MADIERTISFPKIFNLATGKTNLSSSRQSINECLYILLNSMVMEFLGDPMYGANILENTFDVESTILYEILKSKILNAVSLYEPRISMTESDIEFETRNHEVILKITYYIKAEGTYATLATALPRGGNND